MEQRKLIKLGNSSFAIALPKNWVDKSGLKKGDNIFLEENNNGEIMVSSNPQKKNEGRRIEITSEKSSDLLRKEVSAAYINGFDVVIFKGEKIKDKIPLIKEIVENLLGFEIVEENANEVISKDFFSLEDININNFTRRIDNNIREIFKNVGEGIDRGKISRKDLEEIEQAEKDINRFNMLCSRLYIKGMNNPSVLSCLKISSSSLFNFWWTSFNLEHIGDRLKEIAKIIHSSEISKSELELIKKVFRELTNNYIKSTESSHKLNKNIALEVLKESPEILRKCEELSANKNSVIAKLGVKFSDIQGAAYQNSKIVSYTQE